MYSKNI